MNILMPGIPRPVRAKIFFRMEQVYNKTINRAIQTRCMHKRATTSEITESYSYTHKKGKHACTFSNDKGAGLEYRPLCQKALHRRSGADNFGNLALPWSKLTLNCFTFQNFHAAQKCGLRQHPRHVVCAAFSRGVRAVNVFLSLIAQKNNKRFRGWGRGGGDPFAKGSLPHRASKRYSARDPVYISSVTQSTTSAIRLRV